MHSFRIGVLATVATTLSLALVNVAGAATQDANAGSRMIGINVALRQDVTPRILADIARFGKVRDVIRPIDALTLQARASSLAAIRALPYVAAANPDAVRNGSPVDGVAVEDFTQGISTWDLDAINVTNLNQGRVLAQTGAGVYVAVLDTGLLDSWRQYFPQERIAEEVRARLRRRWRRGRECLEPAEQVGARPEFARHARDEHGARLQTCAARPVNGVAPEATVIPVKVLGQQGWGWSSVIARGITYVADLKAGAARRCIRSSST